MACEDTLSSIGRKSLVHNNEFSISARVYGVCSLNIKRTREFYRILPHEDSCLKSYSHIFGWCENSEPKIVLVIDKKDQKDMFMQNYQAFIEDIIACLNSIVSDVAFAMVLCGPLESSIPLKQGMVPSRGNNIHTAIDGIYEFKCRANRSDTVSILNTYDLDWLDIFFDA